MNENLYNERLERIKKAVALEEVDKIPIAPCGNAFYARAKDITLKDYITDFDLACTTNIEVIDSLDADATQNTIFHPYLLGINWLSQVAIPGKELDDDEMWQVMEAENMEFEDYQKIIDGGYEKWYAEFLERKLPGYMETLQPFFEYLPRADQRFKEAGIPCIADFLLYTPFEYFCGGRTLQKFFIDDIWENPDVVDEASKVCHEALLKDYAESFTNNKPIGVWVGGWRTAPELMSPEIWDRFVWPYLKANAELCIEYDVIPMFHLDANWDRELERFRELPAKKCIIALDSKTDIRRAKEILGDHSCILGDVPAELLTFGTPEEVYDHTVQLIKDIGPTGYIVASGCDIPSDAKIENVQAMARAANEFFEKN